MKLSRIDQIALNGGDGMHYKYTEVVDNILATFADRKGFDWWWEGIEDELQDEIRKDLVHLLVENFPNDAT